MWWRLNQSIHSSWLVAVASGCFVVGVAASLYIKAPFVLAVFGLIFAASGFWLRRFYAVLFVALGCLLVGVSYGSAHIASRSEYELWYDSRATVRGRVREDVTKKPGGALSIQLESVSIEGKKYPGSIFVSLRGSYNIKRGDTITVNGTIRPGFAQFPVSVSAFGLSSMARTGNQDIGRVVRDWFASKVREVIPEPQASLGIGFLTGQKSALPDSLSDSLKVAGLTHIVVASGYNLTILVQLARNVFRRLSKYVSAVSASAMVLSFMAVTGMSPSMARAGLVSGMSLMSWYYGHGFHPLVLLPFAAALTVIYQPSYVWGDLGWQLSFAAFFGVMIVGPLVQRYFFGTKEPGVFRQTLGETMAAHIVTVPVIALSFGVISNVAIIANILVVPLVPIAMLLTFICGIGVSVGLPIISIISVPTSWLLGYMVEVATRVSEIPWAQTELTFPPVVWLSYVGVVVAGCFWMNHATKYSFRGG